MTIQEAVKMVDGTAEVKTWENGFWIKGNGWETKVTYSAQRAWELAQACILQGVAA